MNAEAIAALGQLVTNMGPQGQQLIGAVLQNLSQQGQGQPGAGLANLASMFEQNGLGDIMKSWVSTGPSQAIEPQQIMQGLGPDMVQSIARQIGNMDTQLITMLLAAALPIIINLLTPNGKIEGNLIGQVAQAFLSQKAA